MQREIALDTETTGLDPAAGHRIVEIGAVEMIGQMRTGKTFHCYLNPERDMPPEAEQVHGLSAAFLKDKPVFAQVVEDFLDFVGDSRLVIHNAAFDLKFLNAELAKLGFPGFAPERALDTVAVARKKFPGSPASLDALCKRFDIDLSARTKHGALLDAELLCDVYVELSGGRQVRLGLEGETAAAQAGETVVEYQAVAIERRVFDVTQEELAAHAALVGKLKNAVWREFLNAD